MRLLDPLQARHFAATVPAATAGVRQSLPNFYASLPNSVTLLTEMTSRFEVHQVNLLDSVGRWLVYSLAHYKRAFDMWVPVSSPWAQVTLYYSSFFAANALLGMFGGWIGHSRRGIRVVDVEGGTPGSQTFRVHRRYRSPSGAAGSHTVFWDVFYDSAASISPWAPTHLAQAFTPVLGDYAWQIRSRNDVNYDMFHAWSASTLFEQTFRPNQLDSLKGPLALQFDTTEQMLRTALHFASDLGLPEAGLQGCGATGNRSQLQQRLVSKKVPNLSAQSPITSLLAI